MGLLDALLNGNESATDTSGKDAEAGWRGSVLKAATQPTKPAQGSPAITLPLVSSGGMSAPVVGAGLLDRLTAGATNLTTGGNPLAGILNAVNGLATGERTDRAGIERAMEHATMTALMNAGLDAKTARAAAMNPGYLKALVVERYGMRPKRGQVAAPARASGEDAAGKDSAAANGTDIGQAPVPSSDPAGPRS